MPEGVGAIRIGTATPISQLDRLMIVNGGAEPYVVTLGRYIHAEVCGVELDKRQDLEALWPGEAERSWRSTSRTPRSCERRWARRRRCPQPALSARARR